MKTRILILLVVFSTINSVWAQRSRKSSNEIGLFLGGCYYLGDINPNGHFSRFTKPAGGLIFRHNFNPRFAVRANAIYGKYEAHDSYSKSAYQRQRNLNVRSQVAELSGQFEFNFQNFEIGSDKKMVSPYIFAGLAAFYFNPQGEYYPTGDWVDLRPLVTEGQGMYAGASKRKYRRIQMSLPFGVGVKVVFAKGIGLGFEWGMRKTFTDYLDDVGNRYYDPVLLLAAKGETSAYMSDKSIGTDPFYTNVTKQRGNQRTKDWYNFFGITLTIKINRAADLCPGAY